jgi:tRNA U34 2-thiouridine synthase MnmA/TrmU
VPGVLARTDTGVSVEFECEQRRVAPGQTVALYDPDDPDAVVGAGIAV